MSIVDHPAHYNAGKIEVIDAIDDWKLGFYEGNILKYVVRSRYKGNRLQDLEKAKWYLDRLISIEKEHEPVDHVEIKPIQDGKIYSDQHFYGEVPGYDETTSSNFNVVKPQQSFQKRSLALNRKP